MPRPRAKPFTRDHTAVIAEHKALVYHVARQFRGRLTGDDIESVGLLALARAAEDFKPGRGVKFSTFAYTCIANQFRNHIARLAHDVKRRDAEKVYATAAKAREREGIRKPMTGSPLLTLIVAEAVERGEVVAQTKRKGIAPRPRP